jgi:hypothetical protein
VIAEGVETVAHGRMLLRLGCDLAQGYGIARPMPAAALPAWVGAWQCDPLWRNVAVVSRQQMPLLFASAEHRAWVLALEAYLKDVCPTPVALDRHRCNIGQWIDGGGLDNPSNPAVADTIIALHQQIHELAAHLCALKARGDQAAALQQLPQIRRLRDALLAQLERLLSNPS